MMTCLQNPSVPSPFLWNCLIDLFDSSMTQVKSEEGIALLMSVWSAMKDRSIPSLPAEHWTLCDFYSMTEAEIRQGVQLYQTLGDGIQALRESTHIDEMGSIIKVEVQRRNNL